MSDYTKAQPAPKQDENAVAIWPLVIAEYAEAFANSKRERGSEDDRAQVLDLLQRDMEARHDFGVAKYGCPLAANNGRDHLADALQESLDKMAYLRAELSKRDASGSDKYDDVVATLYAEEVLSALKIRTVLFRRDGR